MDNLQQFERHARQRLEEYLKPELKQQRRNPRIDRPNQGVTVILAVRQPGSLQDIRFTHQAKTISRLEARLEAEKAARIAGYPVIGYVVDYQ